MYNNVNPYYQCPYCNNTMYSFDHRNNYNNSYYFETPQYNQYQPYYNRPIKRQNKIIFDKTETWTVNVAGFGDIEIRLRIKSMWDATEQKYRMQVWINDHVVYDKPYNISANDIELIGQTSVALWEGGPRLRGKSIIGIAFSRSEVYYRLEGTIAGHKIYIPGPSHRQVTKLFSF
jgi:hypothetical protein